MNITRRKLLLTTLFGAGAVGLKSFATGLPVPFLTGVREAKAADPYDASAPTCAKDKAQYVFLITSGSGDPMNANVPGTFVNGIYHSADPEMASTPMTLGGKTVNAAKPWATLRPELASRIGFFHHGTYTNAHGDHAKVNRLQGAVQRQEMLVSLFAKNLQTCLGTVQAQPVVLSNTLITFNGAVQPVLNPPSLKAVLAAPTGPLLNLQKIRDTHVDQLNAMLKESGTKAQRATLDRYALSQTEARTLSQDLLAELDEVKGNTRQDINIAATILFKMNVSPVMVGAYSFGGDNHRDVGLAGETTQTIASVAALSHLYDRLKKHGLENKVTIALQNVFGRTLSQNAHSGNPDGRNHNANHHCSILIGAGIKPAVHGAVEPLKNNFDFTATAIGDIKYEDTFASVGKTFGRAVGVDQAVLDDQITKGKVIPDALA